jgi:hypothetical protein
VLIILWPSADGGFNIYGLASIASAFLVAVVMVLIRKLSQVDRPITILSYQAVGVGLLMFVPMLWFWKTPSLWQAGLLVLIGVIAAVGQFINILALRAGETSALAPLDFTGVRGPAGADGFRRVAGKPGVPGRRRDRWRGAVHAAPGKANFAAGGDCARLRGPIKGNRQRSLTSRTQSRNRYAADHHAELTILDGGMSRGGKNPHLRPFHRLAVAISAG